MGNLKAFEKFKEQWFPFTVFCKAHTNDEMVRQVLEIF